MKRNLSIITIGLIIFAACFLISVLIRDYFHEQRLRTGIRKVKVGMSDKEVIEILGKPSAIWMSDGDGLRWCYNTDSIAETLEPQPEITCRHILLRMNGTVLEVYGFDK
jgi:outer membrane protein assembly factor BamE (lipoprotein component of BamABCDE complex)